MKKIIALVIAAILCMVSAFAFADAAVETTQAPIAALGDEGDVDAFAIDEITTFTPGEFNFVDYGFGLYVPADWTQVEITDEIAATGIYYTAYNAATPEEATVQATISMVESAEPTTMGDLATQLMAIDGIDEIDDLYVNDIYFIYYTSINPETDVNTVVFTCETAENTFLSITVIYANSDVANEMAMFPFEVAASIYSNEEVVEG